MNAFRVLAVDHNARADRQELEKWVVEKGLKKMGDAEVQAFLDRADTFGGRAVAAVLLLELAAHTVSLLDIMMTCSRAGAGGAPPRSVNQSTADRAQRSKRSRCF